MMDPMLLWLLMGAALCSLEFFFPTAFVAFTMGLGAIAVAAILYFLPMLSPSLQVFFWVLVSTTAVIASRRFFTPKTTKRTLSDDPQAETLTAIAAGKAGRVIYEGNSWRARCDDDSIEIAPNETVYVIRREGTTLIVMPRHLLEP